MKFYYKYVRTYKIQFWIAISCVVLEAICDLLGPTMMSKMIQLGIEHTSLQEVLVWGERMLAVTAIGAILAIIRNNLSGYISQSAAADLREELFEKILKISEESYHKSSAGSLMTRMTNDTAQVARFINGTMRIFLKAPITCMGSIVLATMLNYHLALIIYMVVFLVAILVYISMKISYLRFYKLQLAYDALNAKVMEYLLGIRLVKAFGTYHMEMEKFKKTNKNMKKRNISSQLPITVISPLLTYIAGLGSVSVVFLGSYFYRTNLTNVGDITAFTIYMAQIVTSLIMITNIFSVFVRTKASKERIEETLRLGEETTNAFTIEKSKENGMKVTSFLTVSHLTFAYPNRSGKEVLHDISFELEKGETLAIIGPTGSGKSTLLFLLLSFYETYKGAIFIQNQNVKQLGAKKLRDIIAYVPQKAMLFYGTIEENLKWGNENAKQEFVNWQIQRADAGFIYNMKEQMQTQVELNAVNLSGGQKQRISIARGLIKRAKLLLLDDVTSALDAITETRVLQHLREKQKEESMIFVTQKCSTARWADKILVLDQGKKAGFGTHEQRLKDCLIYQQIYQSQLQADIGEEEECSNDQMH